MEILLIDDHSSDESLKWLQEFCAAAGGKEVGSAGAEKSWGGAGNQPRITVLELKDYLQGATTVAHKKAALAYGIATTSAEVIFTTDADCVLPPDLISRVAAEFTEEVQVVSGPVFNAPQSDFVDKFQALDLASYQFLTAVSIQKGGPTLANGACFAFRRSAFNQVSGYEGVDHLPSGDDVLLLHKFRKVLPPTAFRWLRDGPVVDTAPVNGWKALWRQRLRWAGKAGNYQAKELQFAQALTFLACCSLLLLIPLTLHLRAAPNLMVVWLIKGLVDYYCLRSFLGHYGRKELLKAYLPTMLLYPFFLVAVGAAALLGFKAAWKGRAL